jgi:hypothetical protein
LKEIDSILAAKELLKEFKNIEYLVGPTANLQELSIDCGWGDQFLILAEKIESEIKNAPNKANSADAKSREADF